MAKHQRTFKPSEWFHMTELAHAAVLAGLLAARRWELGELKFQGGTSLHLVYGSPRFSEDLDFVTASTQGLHAAMRTASTHVQAAFAREFPRLTTSLKMRDADEALDPRNPRLFTLTLSEPDWYQSLKVKIEFFIVDERITQRYESHVRMMEVLRPRLQVDIAQVKIETADLNEILCDKLHALGDRARLKERDVFDLWWICNQQGITPAQAAGQFAQRYRTHLDMYPHGKSLPHLAQALRERATAMLASASTPTNFAKTVEAIGRWLPRTNGQPNVLASAANVRAMVEHAARCAEETATVIDGLVQPGQSPAQGGPDTGNTVRHEKPDS